MHIFRKGVSPSKPWDTLIKKKYVSNIFLSTTYPKLKSKSVRDGSLWGRFSLRAINPHSALSSHSFHSFHSKPRLISREQKRSSGLWSFARTVSIWSRRHGEIKKALETWFQWVIHSTLLFLEITYSYF